MYFVFEDGFSKPFTLGHMFCGVKRKSKRPVDVIFNLQEVKDFFDAELTYDKSLYLKRLHSAIQPQLQKRP